MNPIKIYTILIILSLLVLSACREAPSPQPLPPPTFSAVIFEDASSRIQITSPDLQNKIKCSTPTSRKRGSLLQAQITCKNTSYAPVHLEYIFEWYEDDGFHISSQSAWHPIFMEPGETQSLTSTAKTATAKLFELTLRNPRNEF